MPLLGATALAVILFVIGALAWSSKARRLKRALQVTRADLENFRARYQAEKSLRLGSDQSDPAQMAEPGWMRDNWVQDPEQATAKSE